MKSFLFKAFFIILLVNPCLGQDKSDSLWTVWEDKTQPDSSRIKALCDFANEYLKTNPDSSLFYAKKAYDIAESKGYDKQKLKALSIIGSAYNRKSDYENAYNAYLEAIELARNVGDSNAVANAYLSIGMIHSKKGEYNNTLDYYYKSASIYEAIDNKHGRSNVLNSIGIAYIIQGDYEKATETLNNSIQLGLESKKPEIASDPMTNLAILKTRQGDYAGAIELYMKSLAINEQMGDEYTLGFTYHNIANLYYNQDDTARYFENMKKSLDIRRRMDDKRGIMKCQISLGVVYEENMQYEKALESFNESLAIAEEIDNQKTIALALMGIGLIDIEFGRFDGVLDKLDRGLRINEEFDDQYGICQAKKAHGDYYWYRGNKQRSIEYYSQALAIAEETDIFLTKSIAFELYKKYESMGKTELAFDTYKVYIAAQDSLKDEENQREIVRQEYKYAYDKKAIADSISFAHQNEIQETKLKQTKNQRQTLFIILLIVFAFSLLLINRIRLIRKQKLTIEDQNQELNHLNENLEQKVEERTQKIVEINNSLRKSDERYTYALEASSDGIWDYNVNEDSISYSPAIYSMLGYEPYEFPETREGIYNLLHPEELKNEKRTAHNLFITQTDQDFLLDEYRLVGKDGKFVWVQVKGKIVEKDENNNPLRIVGTHTDISAEKLKNQEMLEAVLRTEDAERSRISKDIHDGLQQTLTISSLNFQSLQKYLKGLESKAIEKFDLGWKYLQDSIAESRNVAHTLMPKAVVDFGILSAFESIINAVNKAHEKTEFHFSHNLETERLDNPQIEITLYRILQEAINNINKYAKASNVHIQLKEYDDIFMLTIEDDGQGFDVKSINKDTSGLGFKSMQNRLDAINGFLEIDSVTGRGTTIIVEINKNK
jgi:PAS domain S-box-containing protein